MPYQFMPNASILQNSLFLDFPASRYSLTSSLRNSCSRVIWLTRLLRFGWNFSFRFQSCLLFSPLLTFCLGRSNFRLPFGILLRAAGIVSVAPEEEIV